MADPTLGEAVGGGLTAFLVGVGTAFKVLRGKSNGNGNGHVDRREWHSLKDVVSGLTYAQKLTEANVARMETTLERHDGKLDGIRDDLARIMAAVDRRES